MAKSPDDIYKEDKVPLFARKGYRRKQQEKSDAKKAESSKRRASLYGQRERRPSISDEEFILLQGADPNKRKSQRHRSRAKAKLVRQVGIILGSIALIYAIILMCLLSVRVHHARKARASEKAKEVLQQQEKTALKEADIIVRSNSLFDHLDEKIDSLERSQKTVKALSAPGRGLSEKDKEKQLLQALKETPHFLSLKLAMANRHIENQAYSQAVDLLSQSLEIDPKNMDARHKLGKTLLKMKDYLAAERIGQWMVKDFPYSLDAHGILAGAYLNTERLKLAIKHLHKIVEFDSRNVVAQNNLGVAYSRMKNYPQAIKIFDNILKMDEVNTISYYNLAFCYAQINRPNQVAEVIEKAATHFGHSFVMSWLDRPDFEPVRQSPAFQALLIRIKEFAIADSTLQLNRLETSTHEIEKMTPIGSHNTPSKKKKPAMFDTLRP